MIVQSTCSFVAGYPARVMFIMYKSVPGTGTHHTYESYSLYVMYRVVVICNILFYFLFKNIRVFYKVTSQRDKSA